MQFWLLPVARRYRFYHIYPIVHLNSVYSYFLLWLLHVQGTCMATMYQQYIYRVHSHNVYRVYNVYWVHNVYRVHNVYIYFWDNWWQWYRSWRTYSIMYILIVEGSVVDPDPYWIRIQELPGSESVFGIWIRIHTCKYRIKWRQKMSDLRY